MDGSPRLPKKPPCPQRTDQSVGAPQIDPARFIGERQERERVRAGITTEGAEAVHHFVGESLRCAMHAQSEYHRRPCESTATAMDETRTMVSDGINVLSGMVSPATLVQYIRNDDGIYGRPIGSERVFTHEMLNLPPPGPLEEPAPPTIATPEFLAQQRTRCATQLAESPPGRHATDDSTADASLNTPMSPLTPHSGKYTVRQTQTRVWTANVVAETAAEAKQKAFGSTRGWTSESDDVVLEAAADNGPLPEAAQAYHDQRAVHHLEPGLDERTTSRHLSDTEQGIAAAFPEVTGDGAVRTSLLDVDLATLITARQARSIGMPPATAAKLRAFLQWALDRHAAAKASYEGDPDGGHEAVLHDFRELAMTALDVAHGRMPLWTLGKYTNPPARHNRAAFHLGGNHPSPTVLRRHGSRPPYPVPRRTGYAPRPKQVRLPRDGTSGSADRYHDGHRCQAQCLHRRR